jgi:hypothetical protein
MPAEKRPESPIPVKLSEAQRKTLAELLPDLAGRLKLDEPGQRTISFTPAELKAVVAKATTGVRAADTGVKRNSLRHVLSSAEQAVAHAGEAGTVYQLKVTLSDARPPVWRRILVHDCTLDELHGHIQTAMGWTNSHLHHFRVGDTVYGDPELLAESFEELGYKDSTATRLGDIVPAGGQTFRFAYEYDFGDSWGHEVVVEKRVPGEPGVKYPACVAGRRACPPEDVGGVWGYADFLDAIGNPDHEQHGDMLEWVGGRFDPAEFDPAAATKRMRRGLPDWRRM